MATANEHVLVSNPDKLVLFAEISGMDSCDREPTVLLRLVVELCSGYGAGLEDVDTMEDLICRVPLRGLGCQGTVERAFGELVASINNPMLRPEVTAAAKAAAARVRARCGDSAAVDELSSTGFLLRVMFIDAWDESVSDDEDDDDESRATGSSGSLLGAACSSACGKTTTRFKTTTTTAAVSTSRCDSTTEASREVEEGRATSATFKELSFKQKFQAYY